MTAQESKNKDNSDAKQKPNEFFIGLVTFIIFIIFMTVWMLLRT